MLFIYELVIATNKAVPKNGAVQGVDSKVITIPVIKS